MLKRFSLLLWTVVLVLSVVFGQREGLAGNVTSLDGVFRVSVPDSWKTRTDMHPTAPLQAADIDNGCFLIAFSMEREGDQQKLASKLVDLFVSHTPNARLEKGPSRTRVGGMPAYLYQIRGTSKGHEFVYLHATIRGRHRDFQVITWTHPKLIKKNGKVLVNVVSSLHELP